MNNYCSTSQERRERLLRALGRPNQDWIGRHAKSIFYFSVPSHHIVVRSGISTTIYTPRGRRTIESLLFFCFFFLFLLFSFLISFHLDHRHHHHRDSQCFCFCSLSFCLPACLPACLSAGIAELIFSILFIYTFLLDYCIWSVVSLQLISI